MIKGRKDQVLFYFSAFLGNSSKTALQQDKGDNVCVPNFSKSVECQTEHQEDQMKEICELVVQRKIVTQVHKV